MTELIDIPKYPKIAGPFRRIVSGPDKGRLDTTDWLSDEVMMLSGLDWVWTEKVDGTNVRIHWDGYKVTFAGRTERANLHPELIEYLTETFPEENLEQVFGAKPVTLYGEGYGPKINNGGKYSELPRFSLFDVLIGRTWLLRSDVETVGVTLGVGIVPIWFVGSVHDAIDIVRIGMLSNWGQFYAEGLVGTAPMGIRSRNGSRINLKIVHRDFYGKG